MYLYIVDNYVQGKNHEHELLAIQTRVQDLGISGRFEKLTLLKSIQEIVKDAQRKDIETFIIVGNDHTVNTVVSCLTSDTVTIGIIPIGNEYNSIARALNIPFGEAACATLSKRIISRLDVGKVNGKFFFSSLQIPWSSSIKILCDNAYSIDALTQSGIDIINFNTARPMASAQDGVLEAVIAEPQKHGIFSLFKKAKPQSSVFPVSTMQIKSGSESVPIFCEGSILVKTPAIVEVVPKRLKMIVGNI